MVVVCEPNTVRLNTFPPPHNLSGVSNDSMSLSLSWNVPLRPNGVITEYQLQCSGGGKVFSRTVLGSQTTTTLSGLP